jgi:hypothetical protein
MIMIHIFSVKFCKAYIELVPTFRVIRFLHYFTAFKQAIEDFNFVYADDITTEI